MISLKRLKAVLLSKKQENTSEDFFISHRFIEGYIKRVFLIGLRLNGVQYNNSVKIIEGTYVNTSSLIEKVLFLLNKTSGKQQQVITNLKNRNPSFFLINDLVLKFTAPYRNRLAHGTIEELRDQELVNWLCHINRSFFKEFESLLLKEFGHSAFENPGKWGAKRGIDDKIEVTVNKLKLGSIVSDPMSLSSVQKSLGGTVYEVLP
jgi:hypothetical protein